ncbi:MAG: hypothetical protein FWC91_13440 [Defluviitaleaceae bacterium]|nr:hypothetical protein [Defluviitaleaceae bacterium]
MEKNTLLEPIIDLMWEPEEAVTAIAPQNWLWSGCSGNGLPSGGPDHGPQRPNVLAGC